MSASGEKRRNKDGGRNDWQTPLGLFALLDDEFHFTLDGAASAENSLCKTYYSEELSAFEWNPCGERIFVNPPYGKLLPWVDLFARRAEYNTVVALVPAAPDTEWWSRAYYSASEVRLLSGRVKFVNPVTGLPDGSNTTGSTVFVFHASAKPKIVYLWDWRAEL